MNQGLREAKRASGRHDAHWEQARNELDRHLASHALLPVSRPGLIGVSAISTYGQLLAGRKVRGLKADRWKPSSSTLPYRYARQSLQALVLERSRLGLSLPSQTTFVAALTTLRSVLSESSVYPILSIDDEGGVMAEWRANDLILEIDFAPDGGEMTWSVRRRGRPASVFQSIPRLRQIIRDLSAAVEERNPTWRALFAKSRTR